MSSLGNAGDDYDDDRYPVDDFEDGYNGRNGYGGYDRATFEAEFEAWQRHNYDDEGYESDY